MNRVKRCVHALITSKTSMVYIVTNQLSADLFHAYHSGKPVWCPFQTAFPAAVALPALGCAVGAKMLHPSLRSERGEEVLIYT